MPVFPFHLVFEPSNFLWNLLCSAAALFWLLSGIENEYVLREPGDTVWPDLASQALRRATSPHFPSVFVAQLLGDLEGGAVVGILHRACANEGAMVRVAHLLNLLCDCGGAHEAWVHNEVKMRWSTIVNGLVGMLASETAGGSAELFDEISKLLWRPSFGSSWTRDDPSFHQLQLVLAQDLQTSCKSTSQPRRTTGVLNAFLILWVARARAGSRRVHPALPVRGDEELDIWAASAALFAQRMVVERLFTVLDEIGQCCCRWIDVLLELNSCNPVLFPSIATAPNACLRKASLETYYLLLRALQKLMQVLKAETVSSMLFGKASALREMVSRRGVIDDPQLMELYLVFGEIGPLEEALNDCLQSTTSSEFWALFLLLVCAKKQQLGVGIQVPISKSVFDSFSKWPSVQLSLLNLVTEPDVDFLRSAVRYGFESGNRQITRCALGILSAEGESYDDATVLHSDDDDQVRFAIAKVTADPLIALKLMDDTIEDIRREAARSLTAFPNEAWMAVLDSARRGNIHFSSLVRPFAYDEGQPLRNFADAFFSFVLNKDATLFSWVHMGSPLVSLSELEQRSGALAAKGLVQSKLRSSFGSASHTLERLTGILRDLCKNPDLDFGERDEVMHFFLFHLELSMAEAAALGEEVSSEKLDTHGKTLRFFHTNKVVCSQWLRQNRTLMLEAAANSSRYVNTAVLWHGNRALRSGDAGRTRVLKSMTRSLLNRREEPALLEDLMQWAVSAVEIKSLRASVMQAASRYDEAAATYAEALRGKLQEPLVSLGNEDLATIRWCANGACESWAEMSHTSALQNWTEELTKYQEEAWSTNQNSLADALAPYSSVVLVVSKALTLFEDGNRSDSAGLVANLAATADALENADVAIIRLLSGMNESEGKIETVERHLVGDLRSGMSNFASTEAVERSISRLALVRKLSAESKDSVTLPTCSSSLILASFCRLACGDDKGRDSALLIEAKLARRFGNLEHAKRCLSKFKVIPEDGEVERIIVESESQISADQLSRMPDSPSKNELVLKLAEETSDLEHRMEILQQASGDATALCRLAEVMFDMKHEGTVEALVNAIKAHSGRSFLLCLKLLQCDKVRMEDLKNLPSEVWKRLIRELLDKVVAGCVSWEAMMLRVAEDVPGRCVWAIQGSKHRLNAEFLDKVQKAVGDGFSEAEFVLDVLQRTAVSREERWHSKLSSILQQRDTLCGAYNVLSSSETLPEDIQRQRTEEVVGLVVNVLEGLQLETDFSCSARNERLFRSIHKSIQMFRNHQTFGFKEGWRRLRTIHHQLGQILRESQQKTRFSQLAELASFGPLTIPGNWDIMITGFEPEGVTLNTKTRPKKLSLQGSDGRLYPFLLKGGEELRVDETVMKIGEVLKASAPSSLSWTRFYEVLPLGERVGLIQWVEHAVPLLTLFKSWHAKAARTKPATELPPKSGTDFINGMVKRLASHLRLSEQQVRDLPRREWTEEVVVDVLREAQSKVPDDLITQHLWMNARDATEWWIRTKRYTRSVASSSILGYLVGLGDRHLDNIMLDTSTEASMTNGEIIHIDFAVCFDKGRRLRVPETVPFRLTPIMQAPMPFYNPENRARLGECGLFARAGATVLEAIEAEASTIRALVENLVLHDDSIKWAESSEHSSQSTLDVNVTLSLAAAEIGDKLDRSRIPDRSKVLVELKELRQRAFMEKASAQDIERSLAENDESSLDEKRAAFEFEESYFRAFEKHEEKKGQLAKTLETIKQSQQEYDRLDLLVSNGRMSFSKLDAICQEAKQAETAANDSALEEAISSAVDVAKAYEAVLLKFNVGSQELARLSLVEEWRQTVLQLRNEVELAINASNRLFQSVEDAVSSSDVANLDKAVQSGSHFANGLMEKYSPKHIFTQIKNVAESCYDPVEGWRYAHAIQWFWKSGNAFDRTSAVIEAVELRSSLRERLQEAARSLSRKLEPHRKRSNKTQIHDQIKPLVTALEGLSKLEQSGRDLRTSATHDSLSSLDGKFRSTMMNAIDVLVTFLDSAKDLKLRLLKLNEERSALSDVAQEVAKMKLELHKRRQVAEDCDRRISELVKKLSDEGMLENALVWTSFSNLKRDLSEDNPYFGCIEKALSSRAELPEEPIPDDIEGFVEKVKPITDSLRSFMDTFAEFPQGAQDFQSQNVTIKEKEKMLKDDILRRIDERVAKSNTTSDRIKTLVSQATSPKRLAKMYEGWTPFV